VGRAPRPAAGSRGSPFDDYDNRPRVFWSYVLAALQRAGVPVPRTMSATVRRYAVDHEFLLRLVSLIAAQDPPVTLVLDDIHLLTAPKVLDGLAYLRRHAGPGLRLVVASRMDPLLPLHRCRPAGVDVGEPVTRDHVDGPGGIVGGQRVADGLLGRPRLPVPGARPLVQGTHAARIGHRELAAQQLGEQMVVAVPLPVVVQRHQEQVLPLQRLDDLRGVGRAGDGVAERGTEPGEDGGSLQELPDLARLAAEYLIGQEADDEPVAPVNSRTKSCGDG
jgi:hypothetical protein